MSKRGLRLVALTMLALGGCASPEHQAKVAVVSDTDGSLDHRVFRIGAVTRLVMEPVLWRLESEEQIDFNRPVGEYLNDGLPPEYAGVTLKMLRDDESGLPHEFISPWRLNQVGEALSWLVVGTDYDGVVTNRASFLQALRDARMRGMVKHDGPRYSNVGYALMMMAICDRLKTTPQALLDQYLVKPLGLNDTSFEVRYDMHERMTPACAGELPLLWYEGVEVPDYRNGSALAAAKGMVSSPADLLKLGYGVWLPNFEHLKPRLETAVLNNGKPIYYFFATIHGGSAFIGFEPQANHVSVVLRNGARWSASEGIEYMNSLFPPPRNPPLPWYRAWLRHITP